MPHPVMFDDADEILTQVRRRALAFPETTEKIAHGRPTFRCGKMFAIYGGSRKGETKSPLSNALLFVPDPGEREALVQDDRFFVPAYVGAYGWLGIDLARHDTADDWNEVTELLDASFRQIAPKRAVAALDAG
ncbi:MmcQ/YjbR family DNA-binding protein [Gordonia liuliyuniae]|uniref:MmcQ/YjbR family DNA-binding protein n=1 Tax=Gordonia liuliyuniae TaxID=2911517 RepID=A0ABS9IWM4_9ACTN|nr:MmcQ/YjbR family DNA-binding protein [Gordonia liuliyuniae]MCF8589553.1 MmcQ/YjbR family DNA-binding protein [Gordonia liuliyuniae]MCF8589963.1 MmcQ/YjbR family DNA-binding protein [Gordonia liuliyuniae]